MSRLLHRMLNQETAILSLTLAAIAALPLSLRVAAPDAATSLLLPIAWIGAAGGFFAAGPRLRKTRAAPAIIILGLLILFIRVGGLGGPLLRSLSETLRLLGVLVLPEQNIRFSLPQQAAWWNAQVALWTETVALLGRAVAWLASLAQGAPGGDMAARALSLGGAIWLVSNWAGWRIGSENDALGGLLPASAWIAVALNNDLQDRWPLWLHLSAFLLLLGLLNLRGLTARWKREHTDFSDSAHEETLLSGIVIIIVLLVVAYGASVFSLKDMLDRLREHPRPASGAMASGTTRGSASGEVWSGGPGTLEITHLITAGPKLNKDVVMVITTGELAPTQHPQGIQARRYYWRGATFERYLGRGWTNPTAAVVPSTLSAAPASAPPPGYRLLRGSVDLPDQGGGAAYWAGMLIQANVPLDVVWRSQPRQQTGTPTPIAMNADTDMIGAQFPEEGPAPIRQYHFDSLIAEAAEDQLRASPTSYPEWVKGRYLQLPATLPERVRALARDLTVRGATPYDRAIAIEAYLRKIPYSLEVPAPPTDRDAADYFLFDLKKGYCDYYATSMVVLARAAGLPARLVTGYANGSYDPYTAQYIVRNEDAHAWAEIYFTGFGWVEFEPTASQPLPRRAVAGGHMPPSEAGRPEATKWFSWPTVKLRVVWLAWWVMPMAAVLLLAAVLIDSLRLRAMEPDRAARQLYHRLRKATRRVCAGSAAGETAAEYAETLAGALGPVAERNRWVGAIAAPITAGMLELTQLYMQSLFAPTPLGQADRVKAIRTWRAIRWRLGLLNLLLMIRRPAIPSRSAPSNLPGSPAG